MKPDGSTHFVFLYQVIASFKEKILPVLQMISEKHDTNILTYHGYDVMQAIQRRSLQTTRLLF